MARFKLLIILALQIILVKSSPFPEVIDEPVDSASRTDTELNPMDVDVTTLSEDVNQQNADMAEQNLAALMDDVKAGEFQADETFSNEQDNDANQDYERNEEDLDLDSLAEDGEREGGEYKEEENLGNSHVIEGDIYKDRSTTKILEALQSQDGRDAMTNPVRQWTGGRVPYVFGRVSNRVKSAFKLAIAEYRKYTCIRVVPRRSERNYLYIVSEGGCWSMIGKSGGRQKLSLGRGCEHKGTAIHELMHALGFFHEQSRRDRDRYITIHWGNIMARRENNFKKYAHGQADTLGEPYDYKSIMHYPRKAFSKNNRETITPKQSGARIGQRGTFSRIDIRQVNKLYKCKGVVTPTKPPTKPAGSCRDKYSGCKRWAKARYCVSGSYIQFMRKSCKKSCGLCNGIVTVAPKCFDKKSSCPGWARSGFCTSKYTAYMNKYCPKSCKKC